MISKQLLQVIAINCDKAQKGKVYLTTIDKDLQYMGEQSLKKIAITSTLNCYYCNRE